MSVMSERPHRHLYGWLVGAAVASIIREARHRQRRRQLRIALLFTAALAITAVAYGLDRGPAPGPPAHGCALAACRVTLTSATLPNPCGLLSDRQAATLLGTKIQYHSAQLVTGEVAPPSEVRMCTWKGAPPNPNAYSDEMLVLSLGRTTAARFARQEQTFHQPFLRIAGLGDGAYATEGPAYLLFVRRDNYELSLQATPAANPTQLEERVAKLVLTRLG
jgi:hypothetical protein